MADEDPTSPTDISLDPKGSGLKFPTAKCLCGVSHNDDYLSLFHPYLLERRKVDTPFGIGICRRDAFRPSISAPEEEPIADMQTSTSSAPKPVNCHQKKHHVSEISISAGVCGKGYVVRSGDGSLNKTSSGGDSSEVPYSDQHKNTSGSQTPITTYQHDSITEKVSEPERTVSIPGPLFVDQQKSISASRTPVNRYGSRPNMGKMSISTGQCGRGYVVRSGAAAPKGHGQTYKMNIFSDEAECNSHTEIRKPGDSIRISRKDPPTTPGGKSLGHQVSESLAQLNLNKDQSLAEDVFAIREQLSPNNLTRISVGVCQSMNDYPESVLAYSPKTPGCKGLGSVASDYMTNVNPGLKVVSEDPIFCIRKTPAEYSVANCTATTSEPKLCYRSKCRFDSSPSFSTSRCVKDSAREKNGGDAQNKVLKIGSNVRILAHPDKAQPSFSVGRPRYINAVVTYITMDDKYKLGTVKGFIGRLFAREELQPVSKGKLSPKQVPPRSINVREASTMSYVLDI